MIKVSHEKIETITKEFGLIELDLFFHGHQVCIKVPMDFSAESEERLHTAVDKRFVPLMNPVSWIL